MPAEVDVLVVGAGLSGICAAHTLRTTCPDHTFAVVEARDAVGGTWDLFRYPGIRSDSDMYTLGFTFRRWTDPTAIAPGPRILQYLRDTAAAIELPVHYGRRVVSAAFDTATGWWTVRMETASGEEVVRARFLWGCAGYYRYGAGYTPDLPGRDVFRGVVVHPQTWPADLSVAGRHVVVLGSGATAVTLVPELAKTAASTVMLQRTPTWIVSLPSRDRVAAGLGRVLPADVASRATRAKNIAVSTGFYRFCRRWPNAAAQILRGRLARELRGEVDLDPHFTPPYPPWDQRLCVVPDGDLLAALRSGAARIVTGHVRELTPDGVVLASGEVLPADVLVTATGLALQFFGGAQVEVDGVALDLAKTRWYRGCLLSGVPNAAFVMGYVNASWTLKAELVAGYVGRLLRHLRDRGLHTATPPDDVDTDDAPSVELSSGYFRRAEGALPRQGVRDPWRVYQDWYTDRRVLGEPVDDGVLRFG